MTTKKTRTPADQALQADPASEIPGTVEETAPAQPYTQDPHWGKGGRYVVDPATGLRRPADHLTPEA